MKKNGKEGTVKSKTERASGDLLWYFLLHNLISVLFFFLFTIVMGIYDSMTDVYGLSWIELFGYLINKNFWELTIFNIFPISVISSILGRITAFYGIRGYYVIKNKNKETKRSLKRWSELNTKINRIGIKFFITALITSFIYSFGVISVLSRAVFNEVTFLPLLIVYTLLKIGVFYFVRWFVGSKL